MVRLLHPERIEQDVRSNLEAMIEGDVGAAEREQRLAEAARRVGLAREAALFEALAKDEPMHVAQLKAALQHLVEGQRGEGKGG